MGKAFVPGGGIDNIGNEAKVWENGYITTLNSTTVVADNLETSSGQKLITDGALQVSSGDMGKRMEQAELNIANIALKLEAENLIPDYNMMMVEDFVGNEMVDAFEVQVALCTNGSKVIRLASIDNIIIGDSYWISDGTNTQNVKVESVARTGEAYSVTVSEPIDATYNLAMTKMYRTTAIINSGSVESASIKRAIAVHPNVSWQGITAEQEFTFSLNTTQANVSDFTIDGDYAFTADGELTIVGD